MKTQLLVEKLLPNEANIITESKNDGKDMWLSGTFMVAQEKNRNGRIYPLSEMANAVSSLNEQIIENNGVLGELDHPDNLVINYRNVSHVIKEAHMDGNKVICKALILDTPSGLIVKKVFEAGVRPAVSSRGAGSVNAEGIVEGFNIITVDIVVNPSAVGARPSLMYEALDSKLGNRVLTLAEQLQQDESAQKYFEKEIKKFLYELINKK